MLIPSQVLFQKLVVLDTDGLVPAASPEVRFETLRPLKLMKNECVGAQVRDVVCNVNIHAVDNGNHHDDLGRGNVTPGNVRKDPSFWLLSALRQCHLRCDCAVMLDSYPGLRAGLTVAPGHRSDYTTTPTFAIEWS